MRNILPERRDFHYRDFFSCPIGNGGKFCEENENLGREIRDAKKRRGLDVLNPRRLLVATNYEENFGGGTGFVTTPNQVTSLC
jgi:hypothetical protein